MKGFLRRQSDCMPEDGRAQRETARPSPRSLQPEQSEAASGEQHNLPAQASTSSEGAFAEAANSFLEEQAKKLRMQPITLAFRSSGDDMVLSGHRSGVERGAIS